MAIPREAEIVGGIALALYALDIVFIFGLLVWLFSLHGFKRIGFILRHGIPWLSPSTIFIPLAIAFLICTLYLYLYQYLLFNC